jgi:uncharacterized protein YcnI
MPLSRPNLHACARLLAGAVTVLGVLGVASPPAGARVDAAGTPAGPGATRITLTIDRGCGGAPTTAVRVHLPEGAAEVAPESPPGWTARLAGDELTWTGGSVPDRQRASFPVTLRVPGMVGDTVFLPTEQVCATGQESWTEPLADTTAPRAAPRITLAVSYAPRRTTTTIMPPATGAPVPARVGEPVGLDAVPAPSSPAPVIVVLLIAGLAVVMAGGVLVARRSTGGRGT